jgi:hypothetical protein
MVDASMAASAHRVHAPKGEEGMASHEQRRGDGRENEARQ